MIQHGMSTRYPSLPRDLGARSTKELELAEKAKHRTRARDLGESPGIGIGFSSDPAAA